MEAPGHAPSVPSPKSGTVAIHKILKLLSSVDQQILCAHSVKISRSWRQGKHTITRK